MTDKTPQRATVNMYGEVECMWCGGVCDQPAPFYTRDRKEWFCSKNHRDASNRALRRFTAR